VLLIKNKIRIPNGKKADEITTDENAE